MLPIVPYETIIEAFASEGVDVSTGEDTSEDELQRKVDAFDRLTQNQRERIAEEIRKLHADQFIPFFRTLRLCLNRLVEQIFVLTLSGTSHEFDFVEDAVRFISEYDQSEPVSDFLRYELNVRYSNGDEIRATYRERERAIEFLQSIEN